MIGRSAVLLLLGISSLAREHKVSSGDEFHAALPTAQSGDTLVFRNGTWRDVKLHFIGKGLTFRAETPGRVILQGSSELIIDGMNLVVSGFSFQNISNLTETVTPNQVTVRRVVVFTTNAVSSRLTETAIVDAGAGVTTYVHMRPGSRSNRVDHCHFSGQQGIGVTFYVEAHPTIPNYHRVDHNYFGDRKPGRGNGWETMRIGHSAQQTFLSGTTVVSNYFFKCNGELECISNKSTGNNYLYNAFVKNQGQLTLRHGDKALIAGNCFIGGDEPTAQGVRISGSDHVVINNYFNGVRDAMLVCNGQVDPEPRGYAAVNNTLIVSNSFENCANNLVLGVGDRGRILTPKNLRVAHNVFRGSSEPFQSRSPNIDVRFEGNLTNATSITRPAAVTGEAVGPAWMK